MGAACIAEDIITHLGGSKAQLMHLNTIWSTDVTIANIAHGPLQSSPVHMDMGRHGTGTNSPRDAGTLSFDHLGLNLLCGYSHLRTVFPVYVNEWG